jgi:NAD(P)-dependent dehydrogenase (short-subunit alcohol dehydrogenase family)
LEITEDDWDRILDVNLKGTTFCIQAVAAQMIRQVPEQVKSAGRADRSYGKIGNFSSISGRHGRALQLHSAASKTAIISVTQSAALSLSPYNINVTAVAHGDRLRLVNNTGQAVSNLKVQEVGGGTTAASLG